MKSNHFYLFPTFAAVIIISIVISSCKNRTVGISSKPETLQSVASFPVGVAVSEHLLKRKANIAMWY